MMELSFVFHLKIALLCWHLAWSWYQWEHLKSLIVSTDNMVAVFISFAFDVETFLHHLSVLFWLIRKSRGGATALTPCSNNSGPAMWTITINHFKICPIFYKQNSTWVYGVSLFLAFVMFSYWHKVWRLNRSVQYFTNTLLKDTLFCVFKVEKPHHTDYKIKKMINYCCPHKRLSPQGESDNLIRYWNLWLPFSCRLNLPNSPSSPYWS